ncbi:MAG: ATP-binding cassette domain-containing protein [Chloroflexi bacterium]|nr:ATP-binding cassette domain-containing protein [Chloroflexota bacterium]
MGTDYVVEMKGISKRFGNVQAINKVDLELRRGEILGLVGDNAAGKSTLMKVLCGALIPDEGEIVVEGKKVVLRNPRDSQALGIAMIYQDLALFNNLDVATNVCAGREYTNSLVGIGLLNKKKMHAEARGLLDKLRVDIGSTHSLVEKMSGGQRQMIACARAIGSQCKMVIMDEPTAALGVKEANTLLKLITELKQRGLSIILITHRIPDVLTIGDRVMVLKGGERQGVLDISHSSLDDIVTLIVRGRASQERDEGNESAPAALEPVRR